MTAAPGERNGTMPPERKRLSLDFFLRWEWLLVALIAAVIRNAEGGRYAEAALKEPVPMHKSVVLNGDAFDYETYPRRVQRH